MATRVVGGGPAWRWGTTGPVGALLGGVLGGRLGLRPTLVVGALGFVLAFLVALLSPLRTARHPPPLATDAAAGG